MRSRFFAIVIPVFALSLQLEAAPKAEELIGKWAAAQGGKEAFAKITSIYVRSSVATSGLTGTAEVWNTASGNQKEVVEFGELYRTLTVFDSGQKKAWIRDQNGKVRELVGGELQDTISSAFEGSFSQFISNRISSRVEYPDEDPENKHHMLLLEPPGGRAVTFYLDKTTFLPVKKQWQDADRTITVLYSDWREVEGVRMPFGIRQTTGEEKYDVLITVQEIRFNEPVAQNAFAKPEEAAPDFAFASGHSALGIPIELNFNHIFVQVRINGSAPLWFLFDTGASFPVINEKRAKEIGLELHGKAEARGAGEGSVDVAFIPSATFAMEGVEVRNQRAAAIALDALEFYEGRRIDGILGYDFISRFVVEIDYAARKLNIYDPKHYNYDGAGTAVPITMEGNIPQIHAKIEQPAGKILEGKFDLDTGSRLSLSLTGPFHEQHNLLATVPHTLEAPWGYGVGGQTKQLIGRIAKLQIGPYALQNLITSFGQDKKGADANPEVAGNIGGEILRRFKLILDYNQNRILFEPNESFDKPFEFDMSGMTLFAEGTDMKTVIVRNVVSNSPAAEAGVQEDDVLKQIDGKTVGELSLEEIREALRKKDATYKLELQRGNQSVTVTLKLRPQV